MARKEWHCIWITSPSRAHVVSGVILKTAGLCFTVPSIGTATGVGQSGAEKRII